MTGKQPLSDKAGQRGDVTQKTGPERANAHAREGSSVNRPRPTSWDKWDETERIALLVAGRDAWGTGRDRDARRTLSRAGTKRGSFDVPSGPACVRHRAPDQGRSVRCPRLSAKKFSGQSRKSARAG